MLPQGLKQGDKVALLSTARKITTGELGFAIDLLSEWGLDVVIGKTIGKSHHQFAGTESERLKDFQSMLDDTTIKAIFCARGGYGTTQIIDRLDFSRFSQFPKWIVGYSDITVLHNHIHTQLNIATIHATMPVNFAQNTSEALETLRQALFGNLPEYRIPANPLNRTGVASGNLIGGNLSLLYALIGTPSDIQTNGKILFLEDLDEYLYHIDRMMNALNRSGKLQHLAGLIVGGFTEMRDNAIPFGETAEDIIARYSGAYSFPVIFGFPAGHISDNRALVMGMPVTLKVSDSFAEISFD